tara:strand:+ start:232 stop:525 length:294 start_codon:yes stop_codon:yes gene_type:complete
MKETIIAFLSSRTNLTMFQCLLYFIVGYIMGEYLTWPKLILMFAVMLCIQFITRTKAVADGMVFRELMLDHKMDANDIVKKMKEDMEKANKDDYNIN